LFCFFLRSKNKCGTKSVHVPGNKCYMKLYIFIGMIGTDAFCCQALRTDVMISTCLIS
jgi:hypothetical protein